MDVEQELTPGIRLLELKQDVWAAGKDFGLRDFEAHFASQAGDEVAVGVSRRWWRRACPD